MEIYDLTRGKYSLIYEPEYDYNWGMEYISHLGSEFRSVFAKPDIDVSKLLNSITILLVESSMANEFVAVPDCQCSIRVPEDKSYSLINDFDIEDWANSKEGIKDDPRERTPKGFTITDLLGVYIYFGEHYLIPRRIFIWMDKIADYAKKYAKNNTNTQDKRNVQTLFDLVLYHELAHALMDVGLYGVHPAPNFSYANDYPYRFIEEAYANGIALTIIMDNSHYLSSAQKTFVKNFVKSQGNGYSEGWEIYELVINDPDVNLDQWMALKVLFNYELALVLRDWWEGKEFDDLWFYKTVGRKGKIAVRDHCRKWGIMELPSQKMVTGFKKYDDFWPFDENGL